MKIGLWDTLIKMDACYAHERGWNNLNFGNVKDPEYQIRKTVNMPRSIAAIVSMPDAPKIYGHKF